MKKTLAGFILLFFFSAPLAFSQDKLNIKYGKISKEDFAPAVYSLDSSAGAVILADIGSTEIVGNDKGWFSLEYKHFRRIRILNKNAYDIANVEISLYRSSNSNNEETLDNLRGATYNLENDKVITDKLEKSAIFTEKESRNYVNKKFTLPNLKEGCIVEYEYVVKSDFLFNLRSWEFQGDHPRLWSEYTVSIPQFLGYLFLTQGYFPFHVKSSKERNEVYRVSDARSSVSTSASNMDARVTDTRWVMKDVPALKEESFTSTLRNHIAKIDFQLSEYRYPLNPEPVMGSWIQVTEEMLKDERFGLHIDRDNNWLDEVIRSVVKGATTKEEKARLLYRFVQEQITCSVPSGYMLSKPLRNVWKDKNGNVADVNLLLTAMLRHEGIDANPVILSTRSHGYIYAAYPLMDKFNYVVVQANLDGKLHYLDASRPLLGFGRLSSSCYNGPARVVDREATPLEFWADSIRERSVASVFLVIDDKGTMSGTKEKVEGYYSSYTIRGQISEEGRDAYEKMLTKSIGSEADVKNLRIDSLKKPDEVVRVKFDFDIPAGEGADVLYINPFFGESIKDNPFKSAERFYPVEMPFTLDDLYVLTLNISENYTIDELPSSINLKLNEEDDGRFEFRVSREGNAVSIRSRIQLKRAYFLPEEYELLREFFNIIVKKHSEQIVLKKKK